MLIFSPSTETTVPLQPARFFRAGFHLTPASSHAAPASSSGSTLTGAPTSIAGQS